MDLGFVVLKLFKNIFDNDIKYFFNLLFFIIKKVFFFFCFKIYLNDLKIDYFTTFRYLKKLNINY